VRRPHARVARPSLSHKCIAPAHGVIDNTIREQWIIVISASQPSGSTSQLFQAANHPIDSFKFWWEKLGVSRGLWSGKRDASEIQDLWIDIRDSLSEIEEFQSRNPKNDQTFFRLGQDVARAVGALSSCERVALWEHDNVTRRPTREALRSKSLM